MSFSFRSVFCCLFLCVFSTTIQAAVFNPTTATLPNGLRVIVVPNASSAAIVQMVWYGVGAADETPSGQGTAHFLEHLMFRGTEKFPNGEFSATIAKKGGQNNAFTDQDITAYYEITAPQHLPLLMEMEADRMQNLNLTPSTTKTERDVVLSERQERTDNDPYGAFFEAIADNLFPNHPYGTPVIGHKKEIEKLTADTVQDFYKKFYAPNNAVLVISGNVDPEETIALAKEKYGHVPFQKQPPRKEINWPKNPIKSARIEMTDPRLRQAHISKYCRAPSYQTHRKEMPSPYALETLTEILDGGEIGILYQNLVVTQSKASSLSVSYDPMKRGAAQLAITAVPAPNRTAKMMEEDLEKALQETTITEQDVAIAKTRLIRSALFAQDSLMTAPQLLGRAASTGLGVEALETWPDKIKAVTEEEVQSALTWLQSGKTCLIGILKPSPKEKEKGDKK